jgi:hypothetical protein
MSTYKVTVIRKQNQIIEVRANSHDEAKNIAWDIVKEEQWNTLSQEVTNANSVSSK